jgi:hypothetical protein
MTNRREAVSSGYGTIISLLVRTVRIRVILVLSWLLKRNMHMVERNLFHARIWKSSYDFSKTETPPILGKGASAASGKSLSSTVTLEGKEKLATSTIPLFQVKGK